MLFIKKKYILEDAAVDKSRSRQSELWQHCRNTKGIVSPFFTAICVLLFRFDYKTEHRNIKEHTYDIYLADSWRLVQGRTMTKNGTKIG